MWRAGASGVTVMGQRLVSTAGCAAWATRCCSGRVTPPPFVIVAVGDQDRIQHELDRDPQIGIYREYVDSYGLGYSVTAEPEATLPAYTGPLPAAGTGA